MMRKSTYNSLKKLKKCVIPDLSVDKLHYVIHKSEDLSNLELIEGSNYLVKIEKYIINEPDNFTLSANWNNGTKPTCEYLVIRVLQVAGKMIKVDSIGYDIDNNLTTSDKWVGWLPRKAIEVLDY